MNLWNQNQDKMAKYAIIKNNEVKFFETFKTFNNFLIPKNIDEATILELGFKKVIYPIITAMEQYKTPLLPEDYEIQNDAFIFKKINIPQKTAKELHASLLLEGETVFEEYRKMLETSTIVKRILGTHNAEIIALVNKLEAVRVGIIGALDLYVATNNIEKLKNFSYNTPEAASLKEEILNFK